MSEFDWKTVRRFVECRIEQEFPTTAPRFSDHYVRIASGSYCFDEAIYGIQSETYYGSDSVPRRCAICGRSEADGAKFRNVAHAIPESLGNKRLISNEECDKCNNDYSKLEQELASMLDIERLFSGVRAKSGTLERSLGEGSTIKNDGIGRPITIVVDETKGIKVEVLDGQSVKVPVPQIKFKPRSAVRGLLKSAWLIMKGTDRPDLGVILDVVKGNVTPVRNPA